MMSDLGVATGVAVAGVTKIPSCIGTKDAVSALQGAGYQVEQMDRGTLLASKGKAYYGFTWRTTEDGKGYSREAIAVLAPAAKALA